ncbi:MAG TPA: class I SAM-dependent methyltransferase [Flavobacteriaceae bacterium]|nr:class I SAM-dependent methyltransferase [Flavobacteriaceae bacterium]
MNDFNRKKHWENIYKTKKPTDVSWYQPNPETSLHFLAQCHIPLDAKIIDVGGGDGFFVDHLLDLGYTDISVLDISETSLERAKKRLGDRAAQIKWIIADAGNFKPTEKYDFWHDRAAFHFLTKEQEIRNYVETTKENININGILVIGTFSEEGPKKCSGIEIKQYSEKSMSERFIPFLEKINCTNIDHQTPFDTIQNFVFCGFRRIPAE